MNYKLENIISRYNSRTAEIEERFDLGKINGLAYGNEVQNAKTFAANSISFLFSKRLSEKEVDIITDLVLYNTL